MVGVQTYKATKSRCNYATKKLKTKINYSYGRAQVVRQLNCNKFKSYAPNNAIMQKNKQTQKKMKQIKLSAYNSTDLFEQVIEVEQNTTENVIANVVGNFFRYHKTMKNIGVKVFKGNEPILLKFEAENINVDLGLLGLKVQQKFKLQNNYKSRVKFHARLLETTKYIVETAYMKPIKTKDVETFIESLG